jgi:HK97 family phage major capsid protein
MNSKLLREKRASDYAIMEDLQKRAAGEGRLMNAEELAQWDAADANFKNYTDQISRLERWNEINAEERGVNPVEQTINAMPRDAREIVKSPEYHTAFMKALAKRDLTSNEQSMLREMRGTATITTAESGLAGGYVIPYQFSYELEKTMAYYGPMLNVSRIITTPQAGTLYWPKVNDTATAGSWHTEGGAVTVQDMTFTRETFGAHVLNTLVKVSVEWANDEFGLLNTELPIMLGERLGRGLNTAFTTGDGSGKPTGFIDAAPSGVESASTGAFTAANSG